MLTAALVIAYLLAGIAYEYGKQGVERSTPHVDKSYDFVVIGGGLAGLVVASRLTENPKVRVLVLESGGSDSSFTDIPLLAEILVLPGIESVTKFYKSTPSKVCGGQPCDLQVGNVLGGGSVHNDLGYLRGNRLDFDEWAAGGAKGWSYRDVLPYMKKFETAEPGLGSDMYRGRTGPVKVQSNAGQKYEFREITKRWSDAARSLNFSVGDYNGPVQKLFAPIQVTVDKGRRQSSDSAYIRPHEASRPNLHILMFAFVTKILFKGKKAIGVEYSRSGLSYRVYVTKEVIVSAGALSTPKILMVSGVGPRNVLKRFGIPVVADLPGVGQGLQDHIHAQMLYNFEYDFKRDLEPSFGNYFKWTRDGSGIFGSTTAAAIGYVGTSNSKSPDDTQGRLWLLVFYGGFSFDKFVLVTANIKPKSRGNVTLQSSDPFADPIIDMNYFSEPEDKQNMFESLKISKQMMETQPFKDIGTTFLGSMGSMDCLLLSPGSDSYLNCISDKNLMTERHFCCTAKMGSKKDPMAVVDPRLRVLGGVKGLRVVDTSIMPSIVRANTQAATYMLAEKGVDMIKQDWKI